MLTRDETMERTAQGEMKYAAEIFLEKLATFENSYPKIFKNLNEVLYSQADLNIGDLINLLQIFSEILE